MEKCLLTVVFVIKANSHYQSQELKLLIIKVSDAIIENKYLIHYGI